MPAGMIAIFDSLRLLKIMMNPFKAEVATRVVS